MPTARQPGPTMETIKEEVFRILDPGHRETFAQRAVNVGLGGLIVLNVLAVVLETVRHLHQTYRGFFDAFEAFSVAVFSIEYVLRVWSCSVDPRYRGLG